MAEQGISILGAPSSGKTTFLAALNIALLDRHDNDHQVQWRVVGADGESTSQLITLTKTLTDRVYPKATAAIDHYRWKLVGEVPQSPKRWWSAKRPPDETVEIPLEFVDASGEIAGDQTDDRWDDLINNLVKSRGIVMLFDPISEFDEGKAFDHTIGVVLQLAQRMPKGKLPHYVAVCVSKFDEVRIFRTAQQLNLLSVDPADRFGFPRVDDDDARDFFAHLCRFSKSGNASRTMNTMELYFNKDRIKYFVTSSIGFYLNPGTDTFDINDYQNHMRDQKNQRKGEIRGPIYPINVVEPLLWISSKLTATPGA